MAINGVKNKGGLTVIVERLGSVKIGDDIEIIVQQNNTPGSNRVALRVLAPKDKKITILDKTGKPNRKVSNE